jgi:hypothetical protein
MMSRVVHMPSFIEELGIDDFECHDPFGITGPMAADQPGPGALVQHLTGFWKSPDPRLPKDLYKAAAQYPCFSVERY